MSSMMKLSILIVLIISAAFSYGFGFSEGIWTFVVLGMVLEFSFWAGLITIDDD